MRRRVRLAPPVLVLCCAAGCSINSADWFEPDWERIVRTPDGQHVPDAAIPRAQDDTPPPLPDLEAHGPLELSVEQAALLALRQNRDLRVAQLTPVINGAFELAERGVFDPELFAEGNFTREEAIETARSTGSQFAVTGDDSSLVAGVRQALPTGTTVDLGASQDRSISNRAPEQQTARVGLTVTQSLLRGFGPAVNLASIRQAQLETQASFYELRGFIESLLSETEIAYWRHLLAARKIEIVERSLDVARQQSAEIAERIAVGVLAKTEEAAARSEIAIREQALIDIRSELETTRLQLLRLMNLPLDSGWRRPIVPVSDPEAPTTPFDDVEDRIDVAWRLRPDLNEARLRLDQDRLEVIRTRNGLLPRLDVFIAFGRTGYATTFIDSFREIDGGETYDFAAGFRFSQFLGESEARGAHHAAIATRAQAAASVENLQQQIELDVRLAVTNARRAAQQIDATITTRELQEETARAEKERFDVGASTSLLVAQAQRDLLQAQVAEVEAVTNYRIALIQLFLAEGSLLERRGVSVLR